VRGGGNKVRVNRAAYSNRVGIDVEKVASQNTNRHAVAQCQVFAGVVETVTRTRSIGTGAI